MNIELKVGHWYQLNNGEVHKCTHQDGVHTFILGDEIYGIGGWRLSAQESVSHEVFPKNLQKLGVVVGDVVICVRTPTSDWYKVGKEYTAIKTHSDRPRFIDDEGENNSGFFGLFIIKSRAETKPKPWGKLTEVEQNEIAGHYVRGGVVEYYHELSGRRYTPKAQPHWYSHIPYRIKPTPKTVTMSVKQNKHGEWVGGEAECYQPNATHEITFEATDGKPDWDSLRGNDL